MELWEWYREKDSMPHELRQRVEFIFQSSTLHERLEWPDLHKMYFNTTADAFRAIIRAAPKSYISETDAQGRTLLSWASQSGDFETMATCLDLGADPEIADTCGLRPLHYALLEGSISSIQLLLAKNADANALVYRGVSGYVWKNSLCFVNDGSTEAVDMLLDHGAFIDHLDYAGYTPFLVAASDNGPHLMRVLAVRGANIHARDTNGESALHVAIWTKSHDCLQHLLSCKETDIEAEDNLDGPHYITQ